MACLSVTQSQCLVTHPAVAARRWPSWRHGWQWTVLLPALTKLHAQRGIFGQDVLAELQQSERWEVGCLGLGRDGGGGDGDHEPSDGMGTCRQMCFDDVEGFAILLVAVVYVVCI
eukprot:scaffold96285_cov33-Attheya_sp.AAC.1